MRKQLEGVDLIKHYKKREKTWASMAIDADHAADAACEDPPEPDDVARFLAIALEMKQEFIDAISDSRARSEKKWARPFAEYIVKFQWDNVMKARKEDSDGTRTKR